MRQIVEIAFICYAVHFFGCARGPEVAQSKAADRAYYTYRITLRGVVAEATQIEGQPIRIEDYIQGGGGIQIVSERLEQGYTNVVLRGHAWRLVDTMKPGDEHVYPTINLKLKLLSVERR